MRVTIRDVARQCGCSITTVSLVLNNKGGGVSESTRRRVWEAAAALNNRPNQLAVSMVTKKSNVLGLIIPDNDNPFFAALSKAVERAARRRGYSLIYGNSDNSPERDVVYMEMFIDRRVDGIVYVQSSNGQGTESDHVLRCAQRASVPLVTIDRQVDDGATPTVCVDQVRGGWLATRHLLDLGHRRIACFTGPMGLAGAVDRLQGYRNALADAGVRPLPELIYEGNFQAGKGEAALLHFLNQGATAIFSCNDLMAYDLYRAARHFGIAIPGDVSVVGFDDIWFSDIIHPSLTTVRQPVAEMGDAAVATLLELVDGGAPGLLRMFEPVLCVRDSAAKPAGL